jgi:hypothetical protein
VLVKPGDRVGGVLLQTIADVSYGGWTHRWLSKSGTVVFSGAFGGNQSGILTQHGPVYRIGDAIQGQTLKWLGGPATISESGTIAFDASYPGGSGVFTPTSAIAKTGDMIDDLTLTSAASPNLNFNGDAVFSAGFTEANGQYGFGIFTQRDLVVSIGSRLFGREVSYLSPADINDFGQIMFTADLGPANGYHTPAIIVATPKHDRCSEGRRRFH